MEKRFKSEVGGKRADAFLAEVSGLSRSYVKTLCDEGFLSAGGKACKGNYKIKAGEELVLDVPENENLDLLPVDIPLDIVYQDDDIAVINKQQGLTVHAGACKRAFISSRQSFGHKRNKSPRNSA